MRFAAPRSLWPYWMAQAPICLFGLAAAAWGVFVLPLLWQQISLDNIAKQYILGRRFPLQLLSNKSRQIEKAQPVPFCNATRLHDLVVLRLAILEEAAERKGHTLIEEADAPLYEADTTALSCAPADPFAWLVLFWLDVRRHGVEAGKFSYLRLSYDLGSNEGWVALWRNQLAMKLFAALPGSCRSGTR